MSSISASRGAKEGLKPTSHLSDELDDPNNPTTCSKRVSMFPTPLPQLQPPTAINESEWAWRDLVKVLDWQESNQKLPCFLVFLLKSPLPCCQQHGINSAKKTAFQTTHWSSYPGFSFLQLPHRAVQYCLSYFIFVSFSCPLLHPHPTSYFNQGVLERLSKESAWVRQRVIAQLSQHTGWGATIPS